MQKASSYITKVGSKKGFSVVVWLLVIALVLYFFKAIMGVLRTTIGGEKTMEHVKEEEKQVKDVGAVKNAHQGLYSKTPKKREYYVAMANTIEKEFNKFKTDWALIDALISRMTDMERLALYIEFGSRYNTEYSNMQGDLADWILKEDNLSPLDFGKGKYVKNIKTNLYRLSSTIPSFKKLSPYV